MCLSKADINIKEYLIAVSHSLTIKINKLVIPNGYILYIQSDTPALDRGGAHEEGSERLATHCMIYIHLAPC